MRKQYIRWILPIIALLLIATFLVLAPVVSFSHAAASTTPHATPTVVPTATPASKGGGMQPGLQWYS